MLEIFAARPFREIFEVEARPICQMWARPCGGAVETEMEIWPCCSALVSTFDDCPEGLLKVATKTAVKIESMGTATATTVTSEIFRCFFVEPSARGPYTYMQKKTAPTCCCQDFGGTPSLGASGIVLLWVALARLENTGERR